MDFLAQYQDQDYARQYKTFIDAVHEKIKMRPTLATGDGTRFMIAVARYLFKLMAYKDEYEVARLYSNGEFMRKLDEQFEGNYRLQFHLAPPVLAGKDGNGRPAKHAFPQWTPWGCSPCWRNSRHCAARASIYSVTWKERRKERRLIEDYKNLIDGLLENLGRR